MEELQVIETTSGRQFKPWASKEDVQAAVQAAVQDPASITAITSEIASGKQAIASAINAKGGSASLTDSFQQLAQDIADIPIITNTETTWEEGQEPTTLGECIVRMQTQLKSLTDISSKSVTIDNFLNYIGNSPNITFASLTAITAESFMSHCVLGDVSLPSLAAISKTSTFIYSTIKSLRLDVLNVGISYMFNRITFMDVLSMPMFNAPVGSLFSYCVFPKQLHFPSLRDLSGQNVFSGDGNAIEEFTLGTITFSQFSNFFPSMPSLRKLVIGANSTSSSAYISFGRWTATNVIAEGQDGIDELNYNITTYLASNLSVITTTKTIYFGNSLYNVLTAATLQAITDKGWAVAGE